MTTNIEGDELREQIYAILYEFGVSGGQFNQRTDRIMELIEAEYAKRENVLLDALEALDDKESEFMGDSGLYLWSSHIADFINAKKGKK